MSGSAAEQSLNDVLYAVEEVRQGRFLSQSKTKSSGNLALLLCSDHLSSESRPSSESLTSVTVQFGHLSHTILYHLFISVS